MTPERLLGELGEAPETDARKRDERDHGGHKDPRHAGQEQEQGDSGEGTSASDSSHSWSLHVERTRPIRRFARLVPQEGVPREPTKDRQAVAPAAGPVFRNDPLSRSSLDGGVSEQETPFG